MKLEQSISMLKPSHSLLTVNTKKSTNGGLGAEPPAGGVGGQSPPTTLKVIPFFAHSQFLGNTLITEVWGI